MRVRDGRNGLSPYMRDGLSLRMAPRILRSRGMTEL
jgi:hypothetical protein